MVQPPLARLYCLDTSPFNLWQELGLEDAPGLQPLRHFAPEQQTFGGEIHQHMPHYLSQVHATDHLLISSKIRHTTKGFHTRTTLLCAVRHFSSQPFFPLSAHNSFFFFDDMADSLMSLIADASLRCEYRAAQRCSVFKFSHVNRTQQQRKRGEASLSKPTQKYSRGCK